jgi:hypothetical protein
VQPGEDPRSAVPDPACRTCPPSCSARAEGLVVARHVVRAAPGTGGLS